MRLKVLRINQFLIESNREEDECFYDDLFVYSMVCVDPSDNERYHFYLDNSVEGDYKVIMEGDWIFVEFNDDDEDTIKSIELETKDDTLFY
ncbi:MAG: hypothetical protein MJ246_03645 [Clostridia bacterium]|nr:hypothetical protein [Clostridia bacterium]